MKIKFDTKKFEKAVKAEAEKQIRQGNVNATAESNCPNCQTTLTVPAKEGVTVKCSNCDKEFEIKLDINWN